jgi:hypothetical protein
VEPVTKVLGQRSACARIHHSQVIAETLHKTAHVRPAHVNGERDVCAHRGHRRLSATVTAGDPHRQTQIADADLVDRHRARVELRLDIFERNRRERVHARSPPPT